MRNTITRRALAACGFAAIVAATVTGCSDDEGSSDATTTTAASASEETTAAQAAAGDEATNKEISDAFVNFFNGQNPPQQRAALVENGATFAPMLEGMKANPRASGTSATVTGVKTVDANNADVTWTLNLNGAPVMPDQTGQAINDGGTWKVSAATFCALLAIQGGGGPTPGC